MTRVVLMLTLGLAPALVHADTYSVFHPLPKEQMRELATDRPDTTESPISIDAGHVQIEIDVLALGFDRRNGVRSTTTDVMPTNFKVGLTDRVDLQLVVEPHHRETVEIAGEEMKETSGYGGTTVRVKTNVWGNDGGRTALALLPFVSRADGEWAAGLAIPFGFELPGGFSSAIMPQVDVEGLGSNRTVSGMFTATAGHDLFGPLAAYGEVVTHFAAMATPAVQLNSGLTFGMSDNVQFDVGTRIGAHGEVPDVEMFVGLAARR